MTRLEASVLINRPVEDIFAFLNVAENHPKFVPGMLEFKKTSPGPLGQVGATVRGVRRFLGRRMELPYEITEYEPNDKLGMQGAMGPIRFKDGYVLEARGSSTRVKFWLEPTVTGLMKLAKPFVILIGRTHADETLANLKKTLEKTD
jgi:carbon monoxide dehydrogenase subunit G